MKQKMTILVVAALPALVAGVLASFGAEPDDAPPDIGNIGGFHAYVDGVVEAYMERDTLAGVTLCVVSDGRIVMLKGYGLANVDPERTVDPERSLFRVGSVSKTFVWTALMQLREEGKLSLDDPVNDHLPSSLRVPDDGFEEPIRIRHLMSHAPGFEDTALGHLFVRDEEALRTLDDTLARFRPHRVRPPGDLITYSNYGAALAGHVVAAVSGVDFETYVEERIFAPLGMIHSTFREPYGDGAPDGLPTPMPETLAEDVADGLAWTDGAWEEQDYEHILPMAPAGAMSSTAGDMARYMLALLGEGQLDERRVLTPESALEIRETLFANSEGMNGLSHGFMQYDVPGRYETFGHGGATLHFMSNMVMVPELDLGVFVSTNSGGGRRLVMDLPVRVIGRFFAKDDPSPEPPSDFVERGEKYAGSYLNTRRAYTLLEKLASLGSVSKVSVTEDGYLLTAGGGDTARWVEVGPGLFREADGNRVIAFREDDRGRVTHMFHSFGITAGERIGFFAGPQWFAMIVPFGLVTAFGMTTGAWLRRKRTLRQTPLEKLSGRLMALLGPVWLCFFVFVGISVVQGASLGNDLLYDFPTWPLVTALVVLVIAAPLTLASVASIYPVWAHRSWPVWRRLRHTVAVLVLVALVLTLHHWNVVGFKYF